MLEGNCAEKRQGAWWYGANCSLANPNGLYLPGGQENWTGIVWYSFMQALSLKSILLSFRPVDVSLDISDTKNS